MRTLMFALLAGAAIGIATPVSAQIATTMCKDGSTSAVSGRGACTDHGGVDKGATKQAKKAMKTEQKAEVKSAKAAGTQVPCTDGSLSNPGRGACSHHGGVQVGGSSATVPTSRPTPSMATPPSPSATPATPAPGSRVPTPKQVPAATAPTPATAPNAASRRGEDNDPTGALAQCKDGMYSHASNHRGACARHKGVAKWLR